MSDSLDLLKKRFSDSIVGRRGGNSMLFLHSLSKSKNLNKQNTIPEVSAMLQGEDFGIPEGATGQNIPFQEIRKAYPSLPLEDALKLEGEYLFPARAVKQGVPISYLKAHENSHREDVLSNMRLMNPEGGHYIADGIGNKGYLPVGNENPLNPSGIEDWLARNYSPIQRPSERKSHNMGMRALLLEKLKSKNLR